MGLDNPLHIAFLVVILLLVFGARRLPEIGRSLGSGMREFKQSITGESTAQQPALADLAGHVGLGGDDRSRGHGHPGYPGASRRAPHPSEATLDRSAATTSAGSSKGASMARATSQPCTT